MSYSYINDVFEDFKRLFFSCFIITGDKNGNEYFLNTIEKNKNIKRDIFHFISKAKNLNVWISINNYERINNNMFRIFFIDAVTHKTKYIQIYYEKETKKVIKKYIS